jgi:hypothetical protein
VLTVGKVTGKLAERRVTLGVGLYRAKMAYVHHAKVGRFAAHKAGLQSDPPFRQSDLVLQVSSAMCVLPKVSVYLLITPCAAVSGISYKNIKNPVFDL